MFTESVTNKFDGIVTIAFKGSFANDDHLNESLATIRQRNIKIVIGFFSEIHASNVLCKVQSFNSTQHKYAQSVHVHTCTCTSTCMLATCTCRCTNYYHDCISVSNVLCMYYRVYVPTIGEHWEIDV